MQENIKDLEIEVGYILFRFYELLMSAKKMNIFITSLNCFQHPNIAAIVAAVSHRFCKILET